MNGTNSKLLAGIVAGGVLGIGGSIAYVKMSGTQSQPAVVAQPPAASQPSTSATLPDAGNITSAPPAEQVPAPEPPRTSREDVHASGHKSHVSKPDETTPPQLIGQNEPPAPVESTPPPVDNPYTSVPVAPVAPLPPAVQESTPAPQPAPPPPPKPRVVTLDPGTKIVIRTIQKISTKDVQSGDTFRATLAAPIVRNGGLIAEKGSSVTGKIVVADRAGHVDRHSDLQLQITQINTSDGQSIRVTTSILDKQALANTKGNAEKVGGGAILGAIVGAIAGGGKGAAIGAGAGSAAGAGGVLLTRGKDVEVPSETELTFQLSQPVTITEQLH